MAFTTPKQKWEAARGRAKWRISGMEKILSKLSSSTCRENLSDREKRSLARAHTIVASIMKRWDKTSREQREFCALRDNWRW